jgi:glycosyltransferase involved in cell wall biosynthesis
MKKKTLISVILPVYNESATFLKLLKKILSVKLKNIKLQIIIIESNSNDGTREQVESLEKNKFDIIFQPRALGKGSAVIEGFKKVKGEIILIQDGDLEYDPKDYPLMIKPIIEKKTNFVLGARIKHGIFGMRKFKNNLIKSFVFNCSHILLTFLFNLFYKQKLKDPWTCYKVFKTSCLKNIILECLGFDFDMELLCKLINNGYYPLEVPVSYKARSHRQGKKVSLINDGPKVIFAMIKSKF